MTLPKLLAQNKQTKSIKNSTNILLAYKKTSCPIYHTKKYCIQTKLKQR
jgi:hypothetical protein